MGEGWVSEIFIYQALQSVAEEVKKALLLAAGPQGDKNITRHGDTKFVR